MKNHAFTVTSMLRLISVFTLMLALLDQEYGFYIFLRWIVCITAVVSAYEVRNRGKFWLLVFVFIGILFNPITPIYLNKTVWRIIDIATAVTLAIAELLNTISKDKHEIS